MCYFYPVASVRFGTVLATQTQETHDPGKSKGTCHTVGFPPPYGEGRMAWVTECFPRLREARLPDGFLLGIAHRSVSSASWEPGSWSLSSNPDFQQDRGTKVPARKSISRAFHGRSLPRFLGQQVWRKPLNGLCSRVFFFFIQIFIPCMELATFWITFKKIMPSRLFSPFLPTSFGQSLLPWACTQEINLSMQIAGIMLNIIRQGKCWKKITACVLDQLEMPPVLLIRCSLLQFLTSGL